MELGPIFRTLIHHKTRFWLIVLQISLTFAIVTNCVGIILEERATVLRPTGMDEENLIVVGSLPFADTFEDEDYVKASFYEDLALLNALPGVESAIGINQIPLSGSGSATGRVAQDSGRDAVTAPFFEVTENVLATLGLELVAGRDFTDADFAGERARIAVGDPIARRNVILSQALADKLFPDEDPLGRVIVGENSSDTFETVIGVVRRMQGSWINTSVAEDVMLIPGEPTWARRHYFIARAEPEARDELITTIEKALVESDSGRLLNIDLLSEYKESAYARRVAVGKMLGALALMLIAVTALGIVGLTSFNVSQRTREIGTRRALGATRLAIVRYFLVETAMTTSAGIVLGGLLAVVLNHQLARFAEVPALDAALLLPAIVGLWLVALGAALVPALRGAAVPPVIATRTV